MNKCHPKTAICAWGAYRKRKWMVEEEAQVGAEMALQAYGRPLETLASFRYLGRLRTATYDFWPEVAVNLKKAWRIWSHLSRILGREGEDPKPSVRFYLAVVQDTLLFGSEAWVATPRMGRFHHRLARRLSGMPLWRRKDGI